MFDLNIEEEPISQQCLHTRIQSEQYKTEIDNFNQLSDPKEKELRKQKLATITAGYYTDGSGVKRYNETILLAVPMPDDQVIKEINKDLYVLKSYKNYLRNGLMIFVKVTIPEISYDLAHKQMKAYFEKKYSITVNNPVSPDQPVIVSADPEAYLNEDSEVFPVEFPHPPRQYTAKQESLLAQIYRDCNITRTCKNGVIASPAVILTRGQQNILYKDTINTIQGKAGTHKSRLAAGLISPFLRKTSFSFNTGIDVQAVFDDQAAYTVAYIDTERNLRNQFPRALQQILDGVGLEPTKDYETFKPASLVSIFRDDRLEAIQVYLTELRSKTENHLIVVIDVVTDCVNSFNNEGESMKLADFLNRMANNEDATIIAVIHENPGSMKARGHLGSELYNKASTALQISSFGTASEEKTIFKVDILKNRDQQHFPPFHVRYDDKTGLLVTADNQSVMAAEKGRDKATTAMVCELLPDFLTEPKPRQQLLDFLCQQLTRKERAIEDLLKEVVEGKIMITDDNGSAVFLIKTTTKPVTYRLSADSMSA